MRKISLICAVVALSWVSSPVAIADDIPGEYVVVEPLVGRSTQPIRKFLTTLERVTLERVDESISAIPNRDPTGDAVIVSNVTGYLFLLRPDQRVTAAMEARVEPPLSRLNFRVAARNSSALAHEWVHFFRMAGLGGRVAPDEPLWFAEGFAEFWAAIAKVKHYGDDDAIVKSHIVRLRDFFDWERQCPGPLRTYRMDQGNSCHYHLGMLAIEFLVANHGGLEATSELFAIDGTIPTFAEGFQRVFGIGLEEFEREADGYIETIRRAELTK